MPLNWTNALTSYYSKLRRFSVDLVGFGPVRVSHVEKPELDQICRTHGDKNKKSLESSNFQKLQDFLKVFCTPPSPLKEQVSPHWL